MSLVQAPRAALPVVMRTSTVDLLRSQVGASAAPETRALRDRLRHALAA
ncbi:MULTISPECIES: hypothetical protein [Catenuloplanes]|uniref:Uncharacterized protein n=1 Tax=Catenuloplanes niger TaxID=587534 RepID=A0AAE4CRD5_9ACTN|nr:hypothetical protein [Catenuloplanes niger]MDR7321432.1 hypothetical protein [Catenuloplanes niger]